MGSWNGTCALSQLPIKDGERAVLLFLKQKLYQPTGSGGVCYSDSFYYPFCPPIHGVYDDYGGIINIDDNIVTKLIMDHFLKNWENFELNLESFQLNKFPEFPLNIEELVNMVERGCLKNIGFMLIHEDLYDKVVKEIGSRRSYGFKYNRKIEIQKKAFKCIEFQNEFAKTGDLNDDIYNDILNMKLSSNNFAMEFDHYHMLDFIRALPLQKSNVLLKNLIDFKLFMNIMEFSRKLYIPQCGSGSSTNEYYIPKLIGEFCIEKEQKVKNEYLEYLGYDDLNELDKEEKETYESYTKE